MRSLGRSHLLRAVPVSAHKRRKLAGKLILAALLVLAVITGSLGGLMLVYSVDLPQIHDLERYHPSTTTDLYDQKGRIIGSFALERRVVVNYDGFAPVLRQAVISIEDKSFESHWGINMLRVGGALWYDLRSHGRAQGASTLTMQLARNLFFSSERTASRKVQEAYLAIQIERAFTKQQIFTLYGNQIYLGHGRYGFEAASQFYFSKHAKELTLPEAALLAGLPKGPAAFSPLLNPEKALRRRNLVLSEMELDRVITHQQAEQARNAPLGLHIAQPEASVAPWFQEEVRRELEKRFGSEQVHEAGLKVETTLDLDLQKTADRAIADGLTAYEHRHGWMGNGQSGKLENVLSSGSTIEDYKHPDWDMSSGPGDYVHAVVTRALPMEVHARVGDAQIVLLPEDWRWTGKRYGDTLLKPGDVIYVHLTETKVGNAQRAMLEQDSGVQGALLAIDNTSGDVLAMVGGRDYALSQFNRATQAERQTGSSFKPYVYTAAVEDGAKPTDLIVDAPVSFGGYIPRNYENDYKGTMTLIDAFAESRNIPALKLADQVGMQKVIDVAHRFGVTTSIPAYLPVALGAVEITLEEQVTSYAVFPNDGLRVKPRLIKKVSNADGVTLWEEPPAVNEVISQQTARTMMILLQAVIRHGTGAAAAQLNHPLGGKTGTTSEYTDAWFLGFSPSITCGVWMGFDNNQPLGDKESGARAALPIWVTWMRAAIVGKDDEMFLSDEPGKPTLKASTQLLMAPEVAASPTRPLHANASANLQPPAQSRSVAAMQSPALPVTSSPANSRTTPSSTNPAANPLVQSVEIPAVQSTSGTPATGSKIKPALIPETVSAKSAGTIKPVIAPVKPVTSPGDSSMAARPPSQAVPSAPLASTNPAARPPVHAAAKLPLPPAEGSSSAKTPVKTALTTSPAPAPPTVTVKPVMIPAPAPKKPKDPQ
ncbi:MAG: PBP1A family penicillin-binding protein [Terracidiphilus sp.]